MRPFGAFSAGFLSLFAIATTAKATLTMNFSTGRDYLQISAYNVTFGGGDLSVQLADGNAVTAPCAGSNPGVDFIPPSLGCPLGTTGFIAAGDLNGDGIRDGLSFYSLSDVVPAVLIEPFAPNLCRLASAPPSDLPRPLGPFLDQGFVVFYNILTANVLQYNISVYEFIRNYPAGAAGRGQMDAEVVIGQYIFTYPLRGFPERPVAIPVTYSTIPEGVDLSSRYPDQGFRFTSGRWDDNGNYLMDPRVTNRVTWVGNNQSNIFLGADQFRLSILDQGSGEVLFPPSGTPLLIPNPYSQEYILPPYFFNVGDTVLFELQLDRNAGTSSVAFDTSVRRFTFNLRFVDSYTGFRIIAFPVGSPTGPTASRADFDGDGQTNIYEFGMQSDPTDPLIIGIPPTATTEDDGRVSFTLVKRPSAALRYQFLVSFLGSAPEKVDSKSEFWEIVTDDEFELKITSRLPADAANFTSDLDIREIVLRLFN